MLEFFQIKHHQSSPYYPHRNRQAEATNKTLIKIINKMNQEYTKGWATHLTSTLQAYRNSPKPTTGFTSFSLVYETEVMNPTEVMTPSLKVMQVQKKEKEKEVFAVERCEDLEGLDEKMEEAQESSRKYKKRMTEAYGMMTRESVFSKE